MYYAILYVRSGVPNCMI